LLQERQTSLEKKAEKTIFLGDNKLVVKILGDNDQHLRVLEDSLSAKIVVRGGEVLLSGSPREIEEATHVFNHLQTLAKGGVPLNILAVNYAISLKEQADPQLSAKLTESFYSTPHGKNVKPKSLGQWQYLQAISDHDIVFAIGPAGTGKTYLAVAKAVVALKQKKVSKIVLTRPAVEAGEKLGFLPGDLQDKVDPYLRPVYDALDDLLGVEMARKYVERNIIEVVPLAYMRGRTLDDAFIILDEAQNTTSPQMKMFLTRMGMGSQMVVTGDITQIDLPGGQSCGLIEAERRLHDLKGIAFCYLSKIDVVRHPLVQKIIEAYERKWV
jgi:phosphate starvation-inducible PhoH-like protein